MGARAPRGGKLCHDTPSDVIVPIPVKKGQPGGTATVALRVLTIAAIVAVGAAAIAGARTTTPPRSFLWKVEPPGTGVPAWLFGTIHVPDARVLALGPDVQRAFASADRIVTEIPLDEEAQVGVAAALLLPADASLRTLLGEARFVRLSAVITEALEDEAPHIAGLVVMALDRLKPWAAMAQLALVEYLPDILRGRPSLDARLYADARAAGKRLSALETVAEQAAVFEAFTLEDQVVLLDDALAQVEVGARTGAWPGHALVDLYLDGREAPLVEAMKARAPGDAALAARFEQALLIARNRRMADRFERLRQEHPSEVLFVAVGTLHLVGAESVPELLKSRGYRVTRVAGSSE